jgi:hypothetical protein
MTSSERPPVGPGRRGCLALALAVLLAGATACGSDANAERDPRPAGATTVDRGPHVTGFEAGELPEGTDSASVALTAAAARSGARGLEVRALGDDAYLRWDTAALGGEQAYWSFRAWVRIVDWTPGESVDLFTVRNREVTDNFDLFVASPDRALMWDLYRGDFGETAAPITPGQWYLVEARGTFGTPTFTAEVRIDGVPQPALASPGHRPSAATEFVLGSIGTAKTNTTQFDDVAIALADAPLDFLAVPAPGGPTATTAPVASTGRRP